MNRKLYIFIVLIILGLSSCSVFRGRKCNCPQWSKETPVETHTPEYVDAPKA